MRFKQRDTYTVATPHSRTYSLFTGAAIVADQLHYTADKTEAEHLVKPPSASPPRPMSDGIDTSNFLSFPFSFLRGPPTGSSQENFCRQCL